MYDFEYESEILLCLRLLKFLHMRSPDLVKRVAEVYTELNEDEMYVLVDELIWNIFEGVDFDTDEFEELSIMHFSHPDIDQLLLTGSRSTVGYGALSNAWRRKIQDISEFFVVGMTNSVLRLSHHFSANGVVFEMVLSPDCYEPLLFANSLIDMVLYCQQELQRLEEKLANEGESETTREEAA